MHIPCLHPSCFLNSNHSSCVFLTVAPPANRCSSNQHTLVVPVQKVPQVLLFLGLAAEFQINVVGKVSEIAKTFLSAAHTVP